MKFCRMVRSGSLALILALGAGCLTPLRADCPPWTVPVVTGWACYIDTAGNLACGETVECVEIPWWYLLSVRPRLPQAKPLPFVPEPKPKSGN